MSIITFTPLKVGRRNEMLWLYNGYRQTIESLIAKKTFVLTAIILSSVTLYTVVLFLERTTGSVSYIWLMFSFVLSVFLYVIIAGATKIAYLQRDATTGMYLRLYIEGLLDRFESGRNDVTIAIVDINGLREVNNQRGHKAGDDLLKQTAKRLHNVIGKQKNKWIGRFGGDEFVVIALNMSCGDLAIEVEEALHSRHPLDNTWGLGVAGVSRSRRGEARTALECADMALLRAKRTFYSSRQMVVFQYDSTLDGWPKTEPRRPIERLRERVI